MAFWRKKKDEFEEMDDLIQERPGIIPARIAEKLNVARSTIMRRLPGAEEAGYLYYEDEAGGLWPFRRRK